MATAAINLVPRPTSGRVYESTAVARIGDLTADERLRFDAVAGMIQDLASDDSADSKLPNPNSWVVKWVVIDLAAACGFGENLQLSTWASGVGPRWAERRSSIVTDAGTPVAEAAALWVRVDIATGRPVRIEDEFDAIYSEAAGGRKPPTKLGQPTSIPTDADSVVWHQRATDMDLLGHMNNAAYFHIIEEVLTELQPRPWRAALEYRSPIDARDTVTVHTASEGGAINLWATSGETLHLTGRLQPIDAVQAAGR